MTTEKEQLEAEIAKRDARISELEAQAGNGTSSNKYRAELYDEVWQTARDMGYGNVTGALQELAALKARQPSAAHDPHEAWLTDPENVPFPGGLTPDLSQQPSASVVLPEFIEHVKHARKELCRLEQSPWRIRQRLAQKLTDGIARINSSPVSTGVVDRWVDIAERLPEIGQHCLIKIPVCGRHEIEGATYEGEGVWAAAWCSSRGRGCAYKVSHWMATPSAQQKESE